MDELMAMLDPKRSLASIQRTVPSGLVKGRILADPKEDADSESDEEQDQLQYVTQYQEAEERRYQNVSRAPNRLNTDSCSMMDLDSFNDMNALDLEEGAEATRKTVSEDVYAKFAFDIKTSMNTLPIEQCKKEILNLLQVSNVVIIQGQTGCGKTTQVPQYILDRARDTHEYCNIAVTQPRKIAATSVARRVCQERGWSVGSVCGYQVGLKRETSRDTILTFMTSGVLLQKLVNAGHMNEYTHILLDEVHERNQDLDFLMLLVRKYMYLNSPKVKIILMSATFVTDKYANYFQIHTHYNKVPAPTIFVPKESNYNTHIYYADQLPFNAKYKTFVDKPGIEQQFYMAMVTLIRMFSQLDVNEEHTGNTRIGNVLVFLPGIHEIEESYRYLTSESKRNSSKWEILPLHSSITTDQQQRVFKPPSEGFRKIILSTNLAESSITVSDIEYVIDFCLTKTMITDPESQYPTLMLQWASHVNCDQRAGRVGRVCDGRVYRLVEAEFYDQCMKAEIDPEILRAPLEKLVLSCKQLKLNDPPKAILALALDPPHLKNIESTILTLKEVGAMSLTCRGVEILSDGDLTFIGEIMSALPLNVQLSKLIVLGYMFSCLEDCIIMAAGCSLGNIFFTPFGENFEAYCNILPWADGSCSDLIAHANLYKVWRHNRRRHVYHTVQQEMSWAKQNFLSFRALREWEVLVLEIEARLARLGIQRQGGVNCIRLNDSESTLFLKICICGAFYPNYFIRSCEAGQVDEQLAVRTLHGHDPFKSVYFTNMDISLPGPLYSKSVRDLLSDCSKNMEIFFYGAKVVVKFSDSPHINVVQIDGKDWVSTMSDRINTDVYKAVRKRQTISNKKPLTIAVASAVQSWEIAEQNGYYNDPQRNRKEAKNKRLKTSEGEVLPTLDTQFVFLKISYIMDAGHFWAYNTAEMSNLVTIRRQLNDNALNKVTSRKIVVGNIYAVKFNNEFRRCRIREVNPQRDGDSAEVLLIDYGEVKRIPVSDLHVLPAGTESGRWPGQAIECVLARVQPSLVMNSRSIWSGGAKDFIAENAKHELSGKIYSVLNNVVRLELFRSGQSISLNQQLIDKAYGIVAEESFLSKERHVMREKVQSYSEEDPQSLMIELNEEADDQQDPLEIKLPENVELRNSVILRGPFSPLEMKIFSAIHGSAGKKVTITGTSVNAVLLDAEPQDPHERLVVAAFVNMRASGDALSISHTTVMPNIHGFAALMALLFSRQMEPKPTEHGTHYAEILCGLGCGTMRKSGLHGGTQRSLYPAHDIRLTLDTELSIKDILSINELRYWMNEAVGVMCDKYNKRNSRVSIQQCQGELKHRIMDILKGKDRRKPIERQHVKDSDKWGQFMYPGEPLKSEGYTNEDDPWPLHTAIELVEGNKRHAQHQEHVEEIRDLVERVRPMSQYTCKFCNVINFTVEELRLHIVSAEHKRRAKDFLLN